MKTLPHCTQYYNPAYSTTHNPYQRVSVYYIGQLHPKTIAGDFCIALMANHYISNERLETVAGCHIITLPKTKTYPYVLISTSPSSTTIDGLSTMKVITQAAELE